MRGLSGIETMRADWDRYFQQTRQGDTHVFAGGVLRRGANDTTVFTKTGAAPVLIHQSDSFDVVAQKCPDIGAAWASQYGFKIGSFVPAISTGDTSATSTGISPIVLAAAAYAAYTFFGG